MGPLQRATRSRKPAQRFGHDGLSPDPDSQPDSPSHVPAHRAGREQLGEADESMEGADADDPASSGSDDEMPLHHLARRRAPASPPAGEP